MAKANFLFPFILHWEGGFVNNKNDRGGATNKGVTLSTWRSQGYDKDGDGDIDVDDLKLITDYDVRDKIFVPHYWNRCKASQIYNQSVANIMVDWVWCSGKPGITHVQDIVGVATDGIVGPKTINAINFYPDQEKLFYAIRKARIDFLNAIVKNRPSQKGFLNGWLNRLAGIRYNALIYGNNVARVE